MQTSSNFDILKTKHWEWVLLLYGIIIPLGYAQLLLIYVLPAFWVAMPFHIVSGAMYLAYPLLTWNRLDKVLSPQTLFERSTWKKVMITVAMLVIAPIIAQSIPYRAAGPAAGIIILSCLIFLSSLPAKQLKSIELKRNAGVWEYVPDTFNFLLWPLGIFWIQPRLNRLLEKRILIEG